MVVYRELSLRELYKALVDAALQTAVVMLLVAETMFFSGLIGAYLVFRGAAPLWPPPNLPRLPLAVTWVPLSVRQAVVRSSATTSRSLAPLGMTFIS